MITVVLEAPNLLAILAFGAASAASPRIDAQFSTVITLQLSKGVHMRPPHLSGFNRRRSLGRVSPLECRRPWKGARAVM